MFKSREPSDQLGRVYKYDTLYLHDDPPTVRDRRGTTGFRHPVGWCDIPRVPALL